MQPILNKLKSRRGVSILYAMLFLTLCAVVGSALLSAATVAAGRAGSQRSSAQSGYYAVSSAAKLLRQELAETQVNIREDRQDSDSPEVKQAPGSGAYHDALAALVLARYQAGDHYTPASVAVSLDPKGENWIDPVEGTLTLDGDYNLTLQLRRKGDGAYPMTVSLAADVSVEESTYTWTDSAGEDGTPGESHVKVHTLTSVTWDAGEIRKGVSP